MMLILEMFGVAVCFGGKVTPKDARPNPDPHPGINCSAKRGSDSASPVLPVLVPAALMPLSALDHGTGSGAELGFTLGEVREARGSITVPCLALLVLLPGGLTMRCCRSRNPQAGPKQLKAPKTPSQELPKAEVELGWKHLHSALPTAGLGCSILEVPKDNQNLPKTTMIS